MTILGALSAETLYLGRSKQKLPKLLLATRAKRFLGSLIDAAVVAIPIVIIVIAAMIAAIRAGQIDPEQITLVQQTVIGVVFFIAYWLLFLLLNGYILFTRGQTIGKVLMSTRIVNLSGNIPSFGKLVVLRYLIPGFAMEIPCIGTVFWLIDCLFIFGQERRCVHDYIAGTKVINAEGPLDASGGSVFLN